MPRYHNINGVRVQFTAEEETARDAEEKAWEDGALGRAQDDLRSKRQFSDNSTIKLKNYILNKNERKLFKDSISIILTEKEVQLLELFVERKKILSKNEILERVWKYSSDTDTHTVETHVYRLRKKIKETFSDEKFILNNENGYSI